MTKALIAGGGIAGSIAAIALAKVGISSTMYERYDRTADGAGLFVTLAVNGIDALGSVGVGHLVAEHGFDTPRTRLQNHRGTLLAEFPMGGPLADGTTTRTILRSDLYRVLRDEAVRVGARVEYGKELVNATETGAGTRVTFADGSRADGDLLIGADGLRSRVRRLIDPNAPEAAYQGLLNTGGIARGVSVDAPPGTIVMVFGRHCFVGYMPAPNGEVWWWANPVRRDEPAPAALRDGAAFRAELRDLVAGDAGPAAALVDATEEIMPPYGTYDVASVPVWHTDRMLIIGDAAHAVSPSAGQGAAQAIEDAVVLGACLRDAVDVPSAFGAYERTRRQRVEAVVRQGRRNSSGKAAGPLGRVVRDTFLRLVVARSIAAGKDPQRWAWSHHIDWDAPAVSAPVRS